MRQSLLTNLDHFQGVTPRQAFHPLWHEARKVASQNLSKFRSGLTLGQLRKRKRKDALETYKNLNIDNAIGYGISMGMTDDEVTK